MASVGAKVNLWGGVRIAFPTGAILHHATAARSNDERGCKPSGGEPGTAAAARLPSGVGCDLFLGRAGRSRLNYELRVPGATVNIGSGEVSHDDLRRAPRHN